MQLPALATQDLTQRRRVERERVGTEVRQILLELLLRDEPYARPLLLSCLREDELAAVAEANAEHRGLRSLRPGLEVAKPARAHQVDAHDEIVLALDGEQEVLAPPARSFEASPVERRQRRRERLQGRDVRRPRLLDRRAGHERVELPHPGLDLG